VTQRGFGNTPNRYQARIRRQRRLEEGFSAATSMTLTAVAANPDGNVADGTVRWARTMGDATTDSSLQQQVSAFVLEPGGEPTIFGQFVGSMVIGTGTLVSGGGHGGLDTFAARLAP
jgi:hypothetical protein